MRFLSDAHIGPSTKKAFRLQSHVLKKLNWTYFARFRSVRYFGWIDLAGWERQRGDLLWQLYCFQESESDVVSIPRIVAPKRFAKKNEKSVSVLNSIGLWHHTLGNTQRRAKVASDIVTSWLADRVVVGHSNRMFTPQGNVYSTHSTHYLDTLVITHLVWFRLAKKCFYCSYHKLNHRWWTLRHCSCNFF